MGKPTSACNSQGLQSPLRKELLLLHSHYQQHLYYTQESRGSLTLSPTFQELCEPQSYCPMHHQDHKAELLRCRSQSKAWEGERQLQEQIALLGKDVSP